MSNQEKMPFVEALELYKEQHFVPFHTPGHKIEMCISDRYY